MIKYLKQTYARQIFYAKYKRTQSNLLRKLYRITLSSPEIS